MKPYLVALGIGAVGIALVALGGTAMAAASIVGGLATAFTTVVAVIGAMFSPVGLIVALLVAGAVAIWWHRPRDKTPR